MKLIEMPAKQAAKVLVRIAMPVKAITNDEAFIKLLHEMAAVNRVREPIDMINTILEAVPLLLEAHYMDVMTVAATIIDKPVQEAEEMSLQTLIDAVRENLDGEYLRFFTQSVQAKMNESNE